MATRMFCFSLKTLAKRLLGLIATVLMLFSLSQPAALAAAMPNVHLALAASSRFAAQKEAGPQEPSISENRLDEMREQRREWQSEVSEAAAAQAESDRDESLGETVKDKLNLEEITEENEIVDELLNLGDSSDR